MSKGGRAEKCVRVWSDIGISGSRKIRISGLHRLQMLSSADIDIASCFLACRTLGHAGIMYLCNGREEFRVRQVACGIG